MDDKDKQTTQLLFEVTEMNDDIGKGDSRQIDTWNVQPIKNSEVHYRNSSKKKKLKICRFFIYLLYGLFMFSLGVLFTAILLHVWKPNISSDLFNDISKQLSFEKVYTNNNIIKNFNIIEKSQKNDNKDCCPNFTHKSLRLPITIYPVHYDIKVYPNLKELTIYGNVTISINVENDSNIIVIHASMLKMVKHKIKINGEKVKANFNECDCQEQWSFEFKKNFKENDFIELYIEYTGIIHKDMAGLYLNEHQNQNGKIKNSVVTQFEPAMARRFIPSFDEPSFKAVFNLSVVREPNHIVRANMPIKLSEEYERNNSLMIDYFAPSVKMSTYILALGIFDDFKKIRRLTKNTIKPIEINLIASSEVIDNQHEFGLSTGIMALEFFENYFNISFPLPKIDLVALDSFSESAMENFGLITFRDSALLFNEQNSTSRAKQHIANVIVHEMAHQYFGNLVTFKWWNDLWLSEGFATFMEYYAISNIYPSWNIMEAFYVDNYISSMNLDGMLSSHSISTNVENPSDISSIFDAISYNKGAAIIQMMKGITGDMAFQKAINEYLKIYSYKNAEGSDLWDIIQKNTEISSDLTVKELAESWTLRMGYPMVKIIQGKSKSEMIICNQTRFLFITDERNDENNYQWPIPIHYVTDSIKDSRLVWFKEGDENVRLDLGKYSKWFIANSGAKGYYRVLYDNNNYRAITKQLKINHRKIKAIDRSVVINDAFSFVKSGYLKIDEALHLVEYLSKGVEKDRGPWYVVHQHLAYIDNILKDSTVYENFQDFKRHLILNAYENLEWDKPLQISDKLFLSEIFTMACKYEIHHCLKQAKVLFKKWTRNKDLIPIDLHKIVIEEGIKQGGKQEWELVYKEYLKTKNPSQKDLYLTALTQTTELKLINRLLNYCLDPNIIKPNVMTKVMNQLMNNQVASVHVWRFFKVNINKFKEVSTSFTRIIRGLVSKFSTKYEYDSLISLFNEDKDINMTVRNYKEILDVIKLNMQWRNLNEEGIKSFMKKWKSKQYLREKKANDY